MKKLFADPRAYDLQVVTKPQRKALAVFWNAWLDTLETVRIVDPACGSGAFLLEAFDQLHAQYQQANDRLTELVNQRLFADVDKKILQSNLFGMDLSTQGLRIKSYQKYHRRGELLPKKLGLMPPGAACTQCFPCPDAGRASSMPTVALRPGSPRRDACSHGCHPHQGSHPIASAVCFRSPNDPATRSRTPSLTLCDCL